MTKQENNTAVSLQNTADEETQVLQKHALDSVFRLYQASKITAAEADSITRPMLSAFALLRDDLTAAWANGKTLKAERDRLRSAIVEAHAAVMETYTEEEATPLHESLLEFFTSVLHSTKPAGAGDSHTQK